jgi:dethiobiotin synthetase
LPVVSRLLSQPTHKADVVPIILSEPYTPMKNAKQQIKNKKTLALRFQTIRQLGDADLSLVAGALGTTTGSTNPNSGCCTNHPQ